VVEVRSENWEVRGGFRNSLPKFLLNCSLTMLVLFSLGIQYFVTLVNLPKYYICLMFIKAYVILTKPPEVLPSGSQ
jgi:hypothetical protein